MTDITRTQPPPGAVPTSAPQPAAEKAKDVGRTATQAGSDVAGTAADQTRRVAAQTRDEAQNLYGRARTQLTDQANTQQKRAVDGLYGMRDELHRMAESSQQDSPATDLVRRAAGRIEQAAGWLQDREPGQLVDEVKSFARRRPGAFLAGAAVLGVVAGRLTKNIAGGNGQPDQGAGQPPTVRATATPVAPATAVPVPPAPAPATPVREPASLEDLS